MVYVDMMVKMNQDVGRVLETNMLFGAGDKRYELFWTGSKQKADGVLCLLQTGL